MEGTPSTEPPAAGSRPLVPFWWLAAPGLLLLVADGVLTISGNALPLRAHEALRWVGLCMVAAALILSSIRRPAR